MSDVDCRLNELLDKDKLVVLENASLLITIVSRSGRSGCQKELFNEVVREFKRIQENSSEF